MKKIYPNLLILFLALVITTSFNTNSFAQTYNRSYKNSITLEEKYPKFVKQIRRARQAGYTDEQIEYAILKAMIRKSQGIGSLDKRNESQSAKSQIPYDKRVPPPGFTETTNQGQLQLKQTPPPPPGFTRLSDMIPPPPPGFVRLSDLASQQLLEVPPPPTGFTEDVDLGLLQLIEPPAPPGFTEDVDLGLLQPHKSHEALPPGLKKMPQKNKDRFSGIGISLLTRTTDNQRFKNIDPSLLSKKGEVKTEQEPPPPGFTEVIAKLLLLYDKRVSTINQQVQSTHTDKDFYNYSRESSTTLSSDNTNFNWTFNGQSGTSQKIGGTTFHWFNGQSGTSQKIGGTTFHWFNGQSGTSQKIGGTTFHWFNGQSGTSQKIGGTTFHWFNGQSGTSQKIGGTTFHWFDGGKSGTTIKVGDVKFINFNGD